MAAATAPVYAPQEPPGPEAAPVSASNDAGTPAPAERTAQVQGEAPGPRVAQHGLPEAAPVCRENLQGKDRQEKVAEPPGQMKTGTSTRGQVKV